MTTIIKCYFCKEFFNADKVKWKFYKGKVICKDCIDKILNNEQEEEEEK